MSLESVELVGFKGSSDHKGSGVRRVRKVSKVVDSVVLGSVRSAELVGS